MALRGFNIPGPCIVEVKGMTGTLIENVSELGLTEDDIQVIPKVYHKDIHVDDFGGPEGPPVDVLAMLGEVTIKFTLVHFDQTILEQCVAQSMGGATFGTLAGCGIPLGGYQDRFAEDNHLIGLNINNNNGVPSIQQFANVVAAGPMHWRFKHCYMPQIPVEWPVGANRTKVKCTWRCIPYTNPKDSLGSPTEIVSTGVVLFDRETDTD